MRLNAIAVQQRYFQSGFSISRRKMFQRHRMAQRLDPSFQGGYVSDWRHFIQHQVPVLESD